MSSSSIAPDPAFPRLRHTNWSDEASPTSELLRRLSFACNTAGCGLLLVTRGCTSRIICGTPAPSSLSIVGSQATYRERIDADAVVEENVRRDELTVAERAVAKMKTDAKPLLCRLFCRGCDAHVGFCIVDAHGALISDDGQTGRGYHLTYWTDAGGSGRFVLRLIDASIWHDILPALPTTFDHHSYAVSPRRPVLTALQCAQHVHGVLCPDAPFDIGALTRHVSAATAQGTDTLLRSLSHVERAADEAGLLPKGAASPLSALRHVLGGSSTAAPARTAFISLTSDPTVALLWALPFGRVAVVSRALAALGGVAGIDHAQLLQMVLQSGEDPAATSAAAQYVMRSAEELVKDEFA